MVGRRPITVEEAEALDMEEWLNLTEAQRNSVVAQYYGKAPYVRGSETCQRGHPFTEENTKWVNNKRLCLACDRWRAMKRRQREW